VLKVDQKESSMQTDSESDTGSRPEDIIKQILELPLSSIPNVAANFSDIENKDS